MLLGDLNRSSGISHSQLTFGLWFSLSLPMYASKQIGRYPTVGV
jgi:hypothetical protein